MARGFESVFELPDPLAQSTDWGRYADQLDPFGSRFDDSLGSYPEELFTYGQPARGGVEFDPLPQGDPYSPFSSSFGMGLTNSGIDAWLQKSHPELFTFNDPNMSTNPGAVGSLGGDWAGVDQWNTQILQAAKKVQAETGVYVPPNVIKAIMKIESNGVMLPPNYAGAVGLMQLTGSTMGNYDLTRAATDPAYNIYAGATELALRYKDAQRINPDYTWSNAAVGYFSGHYEPTGVGDRYNSDSNYQKMFNQNWTQLSGAPGQGGAATPGTSELSAVWGGFDAPVTQEFGWTDFARNSSYGQTAYGYTSEYTRDRKPMGHAGIDVGVKYGTALYAPQGGTVTTAGGTNYYCDADGNGCGPGVGQLTLTYANGDQLILGHMSQITVKPGEAVRPGQFVGYSGSENGAHVHVEYRRWVGEGVTNTGFEVVDPRLAMKGVFSGSFSQPGTGPVLAAPANDWQSFMEAAAKGLPISGAATVGGFSDWLRTQMGVGSGPTITQPKAGPPSGWVWAGGVPGVSGGGQLTR